MSRRSRRRRFEIPTKDSAEPFSPNRRWTLRREKASDTMVGYGFSGTERMKMTLDNCCGTDQLLASGR